MDIKSIAMEIKSAEESIINGKKLKEDARYKLESALKLSNPTYRKLLDLKSRINLLYYDSANTAAQNQSYNKVVKVIDEEIEKCREEIVDAECTNDKKYNNELIVRE